jgi:hypothetical protein
MNDAIVYDPVDTSVGGTHALFIFRGRPEEYNLPAAPDVPTVNLEAAWTSAAVAAGLMVAGAVFAFMGGADASSRRARPHRLAASDSRR